MALKIEKTLEITGTPVVYSDVYLRIAKILLDPDRLTAQVTVNEYLNESVRGLEKSWHERQRNLEQLQRDLQDTELTEQERTDLADEYNNLSQEHVGSLTGRPLNTYGYTIDNIEPEDANIRATLYNRLKQLPEYQGAVDVTET